MHVQSANQPGHEISKTNVNQSGHQTVAGLKPFYSNGLPAAPAGRRSCSDRFLCASMMYAFRRIIPVHADTKNSPQIRREEEEEEEQEEQEGIG